ncbi:hypothetical protein GQR60_07235 [Labilibaculum sp. A4]|uniref:Uncharacterized protein n=1 Tax=Labilibaculum euxinus TaxID=2686357 RepID=A0A425YE06_9BACT|nr:hypothetical protein [Labilibaculum euxinus]MDQ1770956.1 hypothetical protein [Labilibaculum euxinus]MUP38852.1 hypothetical protein [Labilibaculum euxinus]MVB08057.1 hypothetical protein [Labilibaculum euxinus]MWN76125.1 hypothetical protein [Labilibaculum euxinus]
MRQLFFIVLLAIFAGSCAITQTTVTPPPNVNVPKHAVFISQSGTQDYLMQTVLDLKNNEMVVLSYNYNYLSTVIRTGIYLNPDDYKGGQLIGTDAPFKEEVEENKTETSEKNK